MREFFAPLPLLGVALMVVNDRWLKRWLHNGVTGKLSDIAICFFLPLFTSALIGLIWPRHGRGRVIIGAMVAAIVFTAQEIWPLFQERFLAMVAFVGAPLGLGGFQLTSDPTDLFALAMVPLAVLYGWRRLRANGTIRTFVSE
jgi:hypothetical protein